MPMIPAESIAETESRRRLICQRKRRSPNETSATSDANRDRNPHAAFSIRSPRAVNALMLLAAQPRVYAANWASEMTCNTAFCSLGEMELDSAGKQLNKG